MKADNFTNIPQTWDNVDMYVVRTCIWNALQACAPKFSGHLLDVGCGKKPYKEFLLSNQYINQYTGIDIEAAIVYEEGIKPELTWDGISMPVTDNSFDTVMATEVLEHCPNPHIIIHEINRVLKPGGVFFFTVPFLWNLHEVPHDEFRYTPFSLKRILTECGMEDVEIYAHGGWNTSFAQMIGMWIVATKRGSKRKRWAKLLNPFMKRLIKNDPHKMTDAFTDGLMINGLFGMAKKKKD